MKKVSLILALLLLSLILIGCSNEENEASESQAPKNEKSESENEISENESIADSEEPSQDESDRPLVPLLLSLSSESSDRGTAGIVDVWCFGESEDPCNLSPKPPNEILSGVPPLSTIPEEIVSLAWAFEGPTPDGRLFNPDDMELKQIRLGEEEMVEVRNRQFTAPTEPGRYYYSLTVKWNNDLKGAAHYAFSVSVRSQ
ncbi:hypothetical protein [Ornithinibacillus sp. 179-J 7C1 HS]|uniref:hypothetical protein n=1 Tax=Ornithinibacillus sp. 179-J 7C1 HS TaxID=3142384 RepID=UPI00399FDE09